MPIKFVPAGPEELARRGVVVEEDVNETDAPEEPVVPQESVASEEAQAVEEETQPEVAGE